MLSHLLRPDDNPWGGDRTTADGWRELTPAQQDAGRAAAEARVDSEASEAADRAAKLEASPFVAISTWGGLTSWEESRKGVADIRDEEGRKVAILPTFVWREATGLRTLEQQATGHYAWATADGEIVASALVDAKTSGAYSAAHRSGEQPTNTSEWLPTGAARAAYAHWDLTSGVYSSEIECVSVWDNLLGEAPDHVTLREWEAKRAQKNAKKCDVNALAANSPFAALGGKTWKPC